MAQATTTPTAPARYGRAYAEVYQTVHTLTDDQYAKLYCADDKIDADAYAAATRRLDETLDLLDVHGGLVNQPATVVDVAMAVLARDRGLITEGDFATIVTAWVAAGLPLPEAVTGDADIMPLTPLHKLTSDAIADWLLKSYDGTDQYGAVLALTGYNHGELLAYPGVRHWLDRHDSGVRLAVDWEGLRDALHSPELADLDDDARDFLIFALVMSPVSAPAPTRSPAPENDANAELAVRAAAYHLGVPDAVDPRWEPQADQAPEAVPQPRTGWEPSA